MSRDVTAIRVEQRPATWHWATDRTLPSVNGNFLTGLAIAAFLPAVFWALLIKGASALLGFTVGWIGLTIFGNVVFVFLALIYSCISRSAG